MVCNAHFLRNLNRFEVEWLSRLACSLMVDSQIQQLWENVPDGRLMMALVSFLIQNYAGSLLYFSFILNCSKFINTFVVAYILSIGLLNVTELCSLEQTWVM
jgi:hypothetical protein